MLTDKELAVALQQKNLRQLGYFDEVDKQSAQIWQYMADNEYLYHVHPHYGCVLDFQECYYGLVKLIKQHLNSVREL